MSNKNCGPDIVKYFVVEPSKTISISGATGDFSVCSGTTFVNTISGCTDNVNLNGVIFNNNGEVSFPQTLSACTGIHTSNLYGCSPITVHDEVILLSGLTFNSIYGDNTLTQILVRDSVTGEVKYRDVSSITPDTNTFVTGGTLSGNDLILEKNNGVDVNPIDLSGLVSGKTDLTLFNSHTGDINNPHQTSFSNLTSTAHTHNISDVINLQTELDNKLDESTFNTYSGNVQTELNTKISGATNLSSEGIFTQKNGLNLEFKGITSTGGTVNISSNSTSVNLEVTFPTDQDKFVSGGTYNSVTKEINFVGNSVDTTFDVDLTSLVSSVSANTYVIDGVYNDSTDTLSLLRNDGNFVNITGITDTFTTGGTYDNSTALLSFTKNDSTTYDVDMSSLPLVDDITLEIDSNNDIRLKDFVGSPTGGTRTFDGQIIITSGLTLSTLGTGTSINNLGIDSSGNIVVGTSGNTYWTYGSSGNYSIKVINDTTTDATGNYAVAEGFDTLASGQASHAEGLNTTASGDFSHAEGSNGTTASGYASHAEGEGSTASGAYSHAEGFFTTASAYFSHAEGVETTASGYASHAEGYSTTASGHYSHAEGGFTTASGYYSHAEGLNTQATGTTSHAEGSGTIASGGESHAEGVNTVASGAGSHAEGFNTGAVGNFSHAEGEQTFANGNYSHSEGYTSIANGEASHAEGSNTRANGPVSHAEGTDTQANGQASHAEGRDTIADGDYSHAEGRLTTSSGNYSHTEGFNNTASGESSHAEGNQNTSSGISSHVEGSNNTASGNQSHVEGQNNIATGTTAHAEGGDTQALGDYSHAEGYFTIASGDYSHAEGFGGKGFVISSGLGSHAEGFSTTASGPSSHSEGLLTIASGDSSHAEGQSTTASGGISHAEGVGTIASGVHSHAEGELTQATGSTSHAEGYYTIASGDYSHSEGSSTTASGNSSHAEGQGTTASGISSHAGGNNSTASGITSFIHSTNSLVTGNRSVVLGGQNLTGTTDDTVYLPYLNINNLSTGTSINNLGIDVNGNVVVGTTGGTNTNTYVTGFTFNPSTYDLTIKQNDGQPDLTSNLAVLASDVYVVSGVYDVSTGVVTYTNSSGGTFQVSGFTTGMTDSYTTAANLNGETIEFDNNIQGSNLYSVNLSPVLSGKTNNIDFVTHTGDTSIHFTKSSINLSDLGSTAHTHTLSEITNFNSYSGNVQTQLNTKIENGINSGGANEVFSGKSGTDLYFRTISGGTNTTVTTVGDIIKIDSTGGPIGISDSGGTYTYYTTLTLAMAAAVSGDTIKFFANVTESTDLEITIKDGVNIDLNGYSYTLNTTGTSSNFLIEGKGQTVNFYNGRIIRTGGTLSTSNSACIVFGSSVASVYDSCYLNFYDVEILNDFGAGITPNATNVYLSASIYGAKVNTFGQGIKTQKANIIRGLIMNCTSNTYGGGDAIFSNTSCDVIKCVATTTNGGTALVISQGGIGTDCYASTTGTGSSPAINCSYATRVENCVAITTRGRGIYNIGGCPIYNTKVWCTSSSNAVETGSGSSGSIYNCDIYSSASKGAIYQKYVENCNIKSLFSYAVQGITTSSSYIRGGVYYSSASATIYGANECFNATVINEYNNANGHGLIYFQPTAEILNNVIKITNASAYGLFNSTAQTFKYSSNVLSGGFGMVNTNITQGITNTTDSQGNIQI